MQLLASCERRGKWRVQKTISTRRAKIVMLGLEYLYTDEYTPKSGLLATLFQFKIYLESHPKPEGFFFRFCIFIDILRVYVVVTG